jgi:omega-6 fatty acid desaturase (delta-12 desaturase)
MIGAIPKHCFERSAFRSFTYLFADFFMLAAIVYAGTFIDPNFNFKNGAVLDGYAGSAARVAAWALYAFAAGSVGTGVWVIAHECEFTSCCYVCLRLRSRPDAAGGV